MTYSSSNFDVLEDLKDHHEAGTSHAMTGMHLGADPAAGASTLIQDMLSKLQTEAGTVAIGKHIGRHILITEAAAVSEYDTQLHSVRDLAEIVEQRPGCRRHCPAFRGHC